MRYTSFLLAFAILVSSLMAMPSLVYAQPKNEQQIIMGWVENVFVEAIDAKLKAKLDTGATTSSMRADVVKVRRPPYKEGSKKPARRVVFQLEDSDGDISTLERRLIRWVRIKDKKGGIQRRPVVKMEFCVAGRLVHSEVNLAPRRDFLYPVLIGRNMLRDGNIIIDSSKTFTAHARCPQSVDTVNEKDE
jgi:hypothetical protein